MSLVPAKDTALGNLSITKILFEHDGARLFTAQNELGSSYLVSCVEDSEYTETYLYVEVSPTRLHHILTGVVSLQDAYLDSENSTVYKVVSDYNRPTPVNVLEVIPVVDIELEWLAGPEARLTGTS